MDVYENLKEMNLEVPSPQPKGGIYTKVKQVGNLLYVSGQGPTSNGEALYRGKLGRELTLEEGQQAAAVCAMNILSCLHEYLGDLNRVKNVVKLLAFVSGTDEFAEQPQVINGASSLFLKAFGEHGEHARSAIGTNALPGNIPVEIEAIIEI
ncbi:MAG: RidA family protein [Sporomusa sp.]